MHVFTFSLSKLIVSHVLHFNVLLQGVQIIGIGTKDITVGKAVTLVCVSDIPAKIIWEQNNIILAQGENIIQLNLTFIHVNDSIHGNTYTCRVVRPSSQSMVPTVTSTMVAVRGNMLSMSRNHCCMNPYTQDQSPRWPITTCGHAYLYCMHECSH